MSVPQGIKALNQNSIFLGLVNLYFIPRDREKVYEQYEKEELNGRGRGWAAMVLLLADMVVHKPVKRIEWPEIAAREEEFVAAALREVVRFQFGNFRMGLCRQTLRGEAGADKEEDITIVPHLYVTGARGKKGTVCPDHSGAIRSRAWWLRKKK